LGNWPFYLDSFRGLIGRKYFVEAKKTEENGLKNTCLEEDPKKIIM